MKQEPIVQSRRCEPDGTLDFRLVLADTQPVASAVILESVKGWLNAGLGFFYPEACQLCGEARATRAEGYVCAGCRAAVR